MKRQGNSTSNSHNTDSEDSEAGEVASSAQTDERMEHGAAAHTPPAVPSVMPGSSMRRTGQLPTAATSALATDDLKRQSLRTVKDLIDTIEVRLPSRANVYAP